MTITNIRFIKLFADGGLKAVSSVTIDDCLVIDEILVIRGESGLFVSMPCSRSRNGLLVNKIHLIGSEEKREFEEKIIEAYNDYARQHTPSTIY